jgi:hypothetical protein
MSFWPAYGQTIPICHPHHRQIFIIKRLQNVLQKIYPFIQWAKDQCQGFFGIDQPHINIDKKELIGLYVRGFFIAPPGFSGGRESTEANLCLASSGFHS